MLNQSPQLEVVDLSFTHIGQTQPTIRGVNFQLYPGELVVIAGATGSGKSTLLNCIAGIAPNHIGGTLKGKILYQGTEINDWSIRQRSQQFCILLQNVETQIFTDRVWDELAFGLENWNINPCQIPPLIEATLHEFGLEAQRHWPLNRLSAGQKQRLLLACMLTINQPVLLLDEPFAYLDSRGVHQLLDLLKTRILRGQSVLLIEHRLELLSAWCNLPEARLRHRAYRFQNGELSKWNTVFDQHLQQHGNEASQDGFSTAQVPGIDGDGAAHHVGFTQVFAKKDVVQTQNLSWGGYPAFPDLSVAAGEIVLLKGENGCGKTTLLKLLSGLLKPTTGKVELLGQVVNQWKVVKIAKMVGFVLQNPNHQLFADSVRSEILQPGVNPAIADAFLEDLNLTSHVDRHPHALSQGQKRRLALGAVLARQPKICLLDEIMVGQDPKSLSLMLQMLQNFTQQGGTLIFTSHDPLVATALQARIIPIPSLSSNSGF